MWEAIPGLASKPCLIRIVVESKFKPKHVAVVAASHGNPIRALSKPSRTRGEAIRDAVADFRRSKRECTCPFPHLTLGECRRARRAAKARP